MIAPFALALASAALTLRGYVPPHVAADGVRYQVATARSFDLTQAFKACEIDDYEHVADRDDTQTFQFAVTTSTGAKTQCLRARLPGGAQVESRDNWTVHAQAD